jgi:hypothetical protein
MNRAETFKSLRTSTSKAAAQLESGLLSGYHRLPHSLAEVELLREHSQATLLTAVNREARRKWAKIFIREVFEHFDLSDSEYHPSQPTFHVTIADASLCTTNEPQRIPLKKIKSKLAKAFAQLPEASFIGMIEPGYYANVAKEINSNRRLISWHGHFLVWGVARKDLRAWRKRLREQFRGLMPGMRGIAVKKVRKGRFGPTMEYLLKFQRKEYCIGRRSGTNPKTGEPRYRHYSRKLRRGNAVKLFRVMAHAELYLHHMALAGGEGSGILKEIKRQALKKLRDSRRT